MSVGLLPVGNDAPFLDSNGNPLSGGLLYFYTAGSSTPQDTFTTYLGNVANANPVVLGSGGYPTSAGSVVQIYGTDGVTYKAVLKTSAGVTIWTRDYIEVMNDTNVSVDQWVAGPAPTYISATSFSLVGDQTTAFHIGRRVKTTNSGGTVYSTISGSAFAALTTITVVNDSGTLDSGLSAVSYGLLSAENVSTPALVRGATSNVVAPAGTLFMRGGQIGFPATQIPSTNTNALDDYEENDFSASVSDGSGAALAFSSVAAYATKIGDRVMFSITVTYPATADGSNAQINGLPYAVSGEVACSFASNVGADFQALAGAVASGAISIYAAGSFTRTINSALSGDKLYISGNYKV